MYNLPSTLLILKSCFVFAGNLSVSWVRVKKLRG